MASTVYFFGTVDRLNTGIHQVVNCTPNIFYIKISLIVKRCQLVKVGYF